MKIYFTNFLNQCMLLFAIMQCDNALLRCSIFTKESSLGCSDIIAHR